MVLGVNRRKKGVDSEQGRNTVSCLVKPKIQTKTTFKHVAGDMCLSGEMQYEVGPAHKHLSLLE